MTWHPKLTQLEAKSVGPLAGGRIEKLHRQIEVTNLHRIFFQIFDLFLCFLKSTEIPFLDGPFKTIVRTLSLMTEQGLQMIQSNKNDFG